MKKLALLILMGSLSSFVALADEVKFTEGQTCVAWKAKKKMFLVSNVEPVGMSCETTFEWIQVKDQKKARLTVAIATLKSDSDSRDQEIKMILGEPEKPILILESDVFTETEWKQKFSQKKFELTLTLDFAKGRFPLKAALEFDDSKTARIEIDTTFTALKIPPPKVAGGIVANVKDELKLFAQIPLKGRE